MNPLSHPGYQAACSAIADHRARLIAAGNADMALAADYAGAHYDTFRKDWRDRVRAGRFPAPWSLKPYLWRISALELWRLAGEERVRARLLGVAPAANDTADPRPPARDRAALQRRRMMDRMSR